MRRQTHLQVSRLTWRTFLVRGRGGTRELSVVYVILRRLELALSPAINGGTDFTYPSVYYGSSDRRTD